MGIGPVQYMVVAFPGNKFKGEIAPALEELVKSGTIRIIDLAFVIKAEDGSMTGIELEDVGSDIFQAFECLTAERGGFVSEEDHAGRRRGARAEFIGGHPGVGGRLGHEVRGCHRRCRRTAGRHPARTAGARPGGCRRGPRKTATPPPAQPRRVTKRSFN